MADSPASALAPAAAVDASPGGPTEPAAVAVARVTAVLARAEQDWQRGERIRAVAAYDEAVSLRGAGA